MLDFKSSLLQALRRSLIIAYFNLLVERPVNGLDYRLPNLSQLEGDSYDSILVIVDRFTKMIHCILVKVTIDIPSQAKVIMNGVVCHHRVLESIVTDQSSLLASKFWSLLGYFLGIKRKLFISFHPQINVQIET